MRYLVLFILLFSISKPIISQEKRNLISGKVKLDSLPIHDVHIINLATNLGTISNDYGEFNIPVKLGDRLSVSHLNLNNLIIVITKTNIETLKLTIILSEQITMLDEFTLEKPRGIFDQDKDIMTYNGPPVNAKTLKLPYANIKSKKDKAIFKIRSGAVVSLDNLMNILNGNNKRAKILKKLSIEDEQLLKIRKYFTDDFFITDLQIREDLINSFLNFCVNKNIIHFFKKEDNLILTKILIQESNYFPQKENSEIKLALKKTDFNSNLP